MRKNVHLICGGKRHDFDFVRLELLKLLARFDHVRVTVANSYSDQESMHRAEALITYTHDLIPLEGEQDGLQQFLREGGRWFALHGTNCSVRFDPEKKRWEALPVTPRYFEMIGSQFQAHPPIRRFTVHPARAHPLVDGIEPFEVEDQLYLCRFHGDHESLLETEFSGTTRSFARSNWRRTRSVPVMYLHRWEDNEILYLSLGHARGHYDMQPETEYYPHVERGSWNQPVFNELLERGIRWALRELAPVRQSPVN